MASRRGTPGPDTDDTIRPTDSDDVIRTLGGDDIVGGGLGNDRIEGGAGADELSGDEGNDRLLGGSGDDTLGGGEGNDRLSGQGGSDRLIGAEDSDSLRGGPGGDFFIFNPEDGKDTILDYDRGQDEIQLNGFGLAPDEFEITAEGDDSIITISEDQVIRVVDVQDLTADDLIVSDAEARFMALAVDESLMV